MTTVVVSAVLFAALLHAVWNTAVKGYGDRFVMMLTIAVVQTAIAILLLPFAGVPSFVAWPWLLATAVPHTTYKIALVRAYDKCDMTLIYPVARGLSIALVTFASLVLLGEQIPLLGRIGIAAIGLGVVTLSWDGRASAHRLTPVAIALAFGAGASVAAYPLIDGVGVRQSDNVAAFAVWIFILDGLGMMAYAVVHRGPSIFVSIVATGGRGLFAGSAAFVCYWIAIWALAHAPIAMVAALRETSVFFSLLLGRFILQEPASGRRYFGGAMVFLGIVATRGF